MLHAARWKCRSQKLAKKSPSGHHRTTLSGYTFATEACINNREKLVKQQYLLRVSSQYGELSFGPLTAEIGSGVGGTPANFNGFRMLALLLHPRRSTEVNQTLHDVWPSPGLLYYAPNGILPGAEFTLRPSLALSYIGSVTARHSSSGCQTNFARR